MQLISGEDSFLGTDTQQRRSLIRGRAQRICGWICIGCGRIKWVLSSCYTGWDITVHLRLFFCALNVAEIWMFTKRSGISAISHSKNGMVGKKKNNLAPLLPCTGSPSVVFIILPLFTGRQDITYQYTVVRFLLSSAVTVVNETTVIWGNRCSGVNIL